MKVEIWSDVLCPFCYIGKRRFEAALEKSGKSSAIEVEWKSFQLDPGMKSDPGVSINQYLAQARGMPLAQAEALNAQVTQMAAAEGLNYQLDKAVVANSFNAHRLIQLAKKYAKGGKAEEALFKAYFTEGKNIDEPGTLTALAEAIGLPATEAREMLESDAFGGQVQKDIAEAQALGIRGVPFFIFDRKYALSGAQPIQLFAETLQRALDENGPGTLPD